MTMTLALALTLALTVTLALIPALALALTLTVTQAAAQRSEMLTRRLLDLEVSVSVGSVVGEMYRAGGVGMPPPPPPPPDTSFARWSGGEREGIEDMESRWPLTDFTDLRTFELPSFSTWLLACLPGYLST